MVRNYVKKGPKGASIFALTINKVDWPKSLTGFWFQQGDFKSIVVGEEDYHPPLDCDTGLPVDGDQGKHHHCFLETREPMQLVEIQAIVNTLTDDKGYDLQVCKSRNSWIKYITKSDGAPFLFNVSVSECSLFARAQNHIKNKYKRPSPIDTADDFMVSAGNFRNVIIDMANRHVKKLRCELQAQRTSFEPNMECWFTRHVYKCLLDNKHIYLYGPPGVGKTETVDRIVKSFSTWRSNQNDKWMFGTLEENHRYAVFEDFDLYGFSQLPTLLSIMDGKPVSISEKYKNDEIKMFSVCCIFISNYTLCNTSPLYRRVSYIDVTHKMYECLGCTEE